MKKPKTYYQILGIRRPFRGFKMLESSKYCPICKKENQLCMVGFMGDFHYGYERCSYCLVKLPLPKYIERFFKRLEKKHPTIPEGQMVLA